MIKIPVLACVCERGEEREKEKERERQRYEIKENRNSKRKDTEIKMSEFFLICFKARKRTSKIPVMPRVCERGERAMKKHERGEREN